MKSKNHFSKTLLSTIALFSLVGIFLSGYLYLEAKFALAEDVEKLEQRLDYKIISDQLNSVQERIWKLEDRLNHVSGDRIAKEDLRKLRSDKEQLQKMLEQLQNSNILR